MLNLFIAVVVSTMQSIGVESVHIETTAKEDPASNENILREVRLLREELARLERRLHEVDGRKIDM